MRIVSYKKLRLTERLLDASNLQIILFFIFYTFLISFSSFGKGFDFTDMTLTYHFSLRILNGDIPFKDFHTTIMPLSYYLEAVFHYFFGQSYRVNLVMGLCLKFFNILFIYLTLNLFYKNKITSLLFTLFITSIFIGNSQTYFSFSNFALTLSMITSYFAIKSVTLKSKYYTVAIGTLTALTFLTKQNFGVVLLLAYSLYLVVLFFKTPVTFKEILHDLFYFISGMTAILLPFFLYFNSLNVITEIFYILMTGSDRKGLSELSTLGFIDTLLPILSLKIF